MKKYLVALRVGGTLEMPEVNYHDFEIIEANSQDEAREKYNKIHNCSYFYGICLAENINGKTNVLSDTLPYNKVTQIISKLQ